MRAIDLVCVLRILVWPGGKWTYRELAAQLDIGLSQAHDAMQRAKLSRLYDSNRQLVRKKNLMEFLEHGVKYAFPAYVESEAVGIRTAANASPVRDLLTAANEMPCVWESSLGNTPGVAVAPLHGVVPAATRQDMVFYELMTLIDILRLDASARQVNLARKLLAERLKT